MADSNTALVAQASALSQQLLRSKKTIAHILPKHIDVEKFIKTAYVLGLKNPKLLENPRSLVAALIQSAQLGLEVDDNRGHAYLVPFWNSAKKRNDVVFIPGYRGLMDLAYRSNRVMSITYGVVYDKEDFTYEEGLKPKLVHTPKPVATRGKEKIAVYAVATMRGGATAHAWLWKEEVEEHRAKSSSYQGYLAKRVKAENCIWLANERDMWIKTAIRVLAKFIPQSPELATAIGIEDMADSGKNPTLGIQAEVFGDIFGAGGEDEGGDQPEGAGGIESGTDQAAKAATEQKQSDLKDKIHDKEPKPEGGKDGGGKKEEGTHGK